MVDNRPEVAVYGCSLLSVFVGLVNNNNKYIQKLNVNRMLYYRIIVGVVGIVKDKLNLLYLGTVQEYELK